MKKKSKLLSFSRGKSKMYVCTPLIPATDMHEDTMHGPGRHWGLKHDNNFPIHIYRIEWLQKLDKSVDWCLLWKKRLEVTSALLQQHKCIICECTSSAEGVLHFKSQMNTLFCVHLPDWQRTSRFLKRILYEVTKHLSPVVMTWDFSVWC